MEITGKKKRTFKYQKLMIFFIVLLMVMFSIGTQNAWAKPVVDPSLDAQIDAIGWGESLIMVDKESLGADSMQEIADIAKAEGFIITAEYKHVGGFSGVMTRNALDKLKDVEGLQILELKKSYTLDPIIEDNEIQTDVSVVAINANRTWEIYNLTGQGVNVAILDTGIDYNHGDLGGCFGAGCRVELGWDCYNNDNDPDDDHWHGTHVAGIVGGRGTITGVAPNVTFYAYKVCSASGSCPNDDIVEGFNRAVANGSDIIQMSVGGWYIPFPGSSSTMTAAENAIAQNITVVISAGNNGRGQGLAVSTISSPAMATGVISVAASNDQNTVDTSDDDIASFSSRGPKPFGRFAPWVSAPGTSIYSTVSGGGYGTASGTSMAAPHVSGAAALLLEWNNSLTPTQVASRLLHSAMDLPQNPFDEGSGQINITAALEMSFDALSNNTPVIEVIAGLGRVTVHNITVFSYGPAVNLSFSIETINEQKLKGIIPESAVTLPDYTELDGDEQKQVTLLFDIPSDTNASVYQTILVITANDSRTVRVPVSITVPFQYEDYVSRDFDADSTYYYKGDVMYYLVEHYENSSFSAKINWTGNSLIDDWDLYGWDMGYTGKFSSLQWNTYYESGSYSDASSRGTWVGIHAFNGSVYPRGITINLTTTFAVVMLQPDNMTGVNGSVLEVNFSALDEGTVTFAVNDSVWTAVDSDTFRWNISEANAGLKWFNVSATEDGDVSWKYFVVNVTPANEAPNASNVAVIPAELTVLTNATCNYTYTDPESGEESGTLIKWFYNGTENKTHENSSILTGNQYRKTDALICEVTPGDGINLGDAVNSSENIAGDVAPELSSPSLSPISGNSSTLFNFTVVYTDADNEAPNYVNVSVIGVHYNMAAANASDTDFTDGNMYYREVSFSDGTYSHDYFAYGGGAGTNITDRSGPIVGNFQVISLVQGWNFISLPLQPFNTSLGAVLSNISGKYDYITTYNGTWQSSINGTGTLTDIVAGAGYWIKMNQAAGLLVNGTSVSNRTELLDGWNLIGIRSQQDQDQEDLASMGGAGTIIWGYSEGRWYGYGSSWAPYLNSLGALESGKAYWVYTESGFNWTVS